MGVGLEEIGGRGVKSFKPGEKRMKRVGSDWKGGGVSKIDD